MKKRRKILLIAVWRLFVLITALYSHSDISMNEERTLLNGRAKVSNCYI